MDTTAPFVLHVLDEKFILEPPLNIDSGSCLSFSQGQSAEDSSALRIAVETRSAVLTESGRKVPVYAVLGFFKLLRGTYIGLITRSKRIGKLPNGAVVHQVLHVDVLPIPYTTSDSKEEKPLKLTADEWKAEAQYLAHIRHVTDSGMLYYSHDYDLTNTAQRNASLDKARTNKTARIKMADPRFFWNKHLVKEFVAEGLQQWVHPIISGHVAVQSDMPLSDDIHLDYVFISRRSCGNQGTRFNVRGLDEDGCAANFVESEQIISPAARQVVIDEESSKRILLCSYVQTRGSIPLAWSQKVTLKYMPRTRITAHAEELQNRFEKHFGPVTRRSGEHSFSIYNKIVAVNLIDRTGSSKAATDQRELGEMYESMKNKLGDKRLRLVWFDFHHECRKMKWENLSKLVEAVKEDLHSHGYFVQAVDGSVLRTQQGVFRTNCMDNLDRTNVVQSLFARQVALRQFQYLVESFPDRSPGELKSVSKAIQSPDVLSSPFAQFEFVFKNIWADNADAMSILYSGTPALKTDFTRTGKRTKAGLLQDGWNSVKRYYINNFDDGRRQDAVDLFLGKVPHVSSRDRYPRVQGAQGEAIRVLAFQVGGLYLFILAAVSLWFSSQSAGARVFLATTTWGCIVGVAGNRLLKKGATSSTVAKYVNQPSYSKPGS